MPVVGIAILAKVKILHSSYSNALGIVLQLLLGSSCRACRGTSWGTMLNPTVHANAKDFIKTSESRRKSPPVARQLSSPCKMSCCKILNFYACNSEQPRYRSVQQVFISLQFSPLLSDIQKLGTLPDFCVILRELYIAIFSDVG